MLQTHVYCEANKTMNSMRASSSPKASLPRLPKSVDEINSI